MNRHIFLHLFISLFITLAMVSLALIVKQFSDFGQDAFQNEQPVVLVGQDAFRNEQPVVLDWARAQEVNNNGFKLYCAPVNDFAQIETERSSTLLLTKIEYLNLNPILPEGGFHETP